jgi:hypothetical protein
MSDMNRKRRLVAPSSVSSVGLQADTVASKELLPPKALTQSDGAPNHPKQWITGNLKIEPQFTQTDQRAYPELQPLETSIGGYAFAEELCLPA